MPRAGIAHRTDAPKRVAHCQGKESHAPHGYCQKDRAPHHRPARHYRHGDNSPEPLLLSARHAAAVAARPAPAHLRQGAGRGGRHHPGAGARRHAPRQQPVLPRLDNGGRTGGQRRHRLPNARLDAGKLRHPHRQLRLRRKPQLLRRQRRRPQHHRHGRPRLRRLVVVPRLPRLQRPPASPTSTSTIRSGAPPPTRTSASTSAAHSPALSPPASASRPWRSGWTK